MALNYAPKMEYENDPSFQIGSMTELFSLSECFRSSMTEWIGESPGMCCCGGKVKLDQLAEPPEPLRSLVTGKDPRSKEFLEHARKYNSAFQMTSFGGQIVGEGNYMPTFKVQGQVYHLLGSLLPSLSQDNKFPQIYFMGDEKSEADKRCQIISDLKRDIIEDLQSMLHTNNSYVRDFRTAIEMNGQESFRVVIHENKKPRQILSG